MTPRKVARILVAPNERDAARRIVRTTYEAQGYAIDESFATFLEGPSATTFGLFNGEVLYGTISIINDGAQGLPMDSIYAVELAAWRGEGKKLAEVVQFAMDHTLYEAVAGAKPSPFEAASLFTMVLTYALETHIDYLCISINPKHDTFYSLLGFTQIGALKHYGTVNAPAIARALYVPEWRSQTLLAQFMDAERSH
uniref:Long-chain N-acyl amino acid synthase n=1 Tax=uncultured bacterium CSLC2 TaxID=1091571 RepID=Q8KNZ7_9BACT|nr:long-chain N-acyl amino acid synthase [uncultured bacterium CSLC2]